MKTTCKHCGIVSMPHKCPHRHNRFNNNNRKDKRLYKTGIYQRIRADVMATFNYICIFSFYFVGDVIKAEEAHHIVEILEDETLALDEENLIPVTDKAHKKIHRIYNKGHKEKEKLKELLRLAREEYLSGDRTPGKFKNRLKF